MTTIQRTLIFACLQFALPLFTVAQNSSLMQAPAPARSFRPIGNVPSPPPPASEIRRSRKSGYDARLAQLRAEGDYDNGYQDDPDQTPGANGAGYQGQPNNQGYDPYRQAPRPAISLNDASWTYQQPPPRRVFQKNDVVTIRVDEITRMLAEGNAEQRKRTLSEAILTDWIRLDNFRLRPDPQGFGDPAVAAESNTNYRARSLLESRESLTFNIAATVVDIRPNGNLVLEARKAIRVNDNLWETSLSGLCRAEDIAPDNVVLSKDVIDLEIRKEDRGHLREGYSRGWLKRFIDRFGPF